MAAIAPLPPSLETDSGFESQPNSTVNGVVKGAANGDALSLKTQQAPISIDKVNAFHQNLSRQPPSDIVAVQLNKTSLLFYVNSQCVISYLEGPADGKEGDNTPYYVRKEISVGKVLQKTHSSTKQIAAVSYTDFKNKNSKEIRVYFASEDNRYIREVCKTNDGPWYIGSLGYRTKYRIAAGSSMSAQIHSESSISKVFCAREDSTRPDGAAELDVFYVSTGESTWTPCTITERGMEY